MGVLVGQFQPYRVAVAADAENPGGATPALIAADKSSAIETKGYTGIILNVTLSATGAGTAKLRLMHWDAQEQQWYEGEEVVIAAKGRVQPAPILTKGVPAWIKVTEITGTDAEIAIRYGMYRYSTLH
jgi:hypothetical protein